MTHSWLILIHNEIIQQKSSPKLQYTIKVSKDRDSNHRRKCLLTALIEHSESSVTVLGLTSVYRELETVCPSEVLAVRIDFGYSRLGCFLSHPMLTPIPSRLSDTRCPVHFGFTCMHVYNLAFTMTKSGSRK